jgi:cell division protein ZapA (FtsZ GTPase activity inhibitor)
MPELILEIGGRVYEVACESGQEPMLERAARLLDNEATRIGEEGRATEKRMLLLAGLMLGDTLTALESEHRAIEERLRHAEERARIAEAKSAMLAANALKLETEASHRFSSNEVEAVREENEAAAMLLGQVVAEINAIADTVETGA